MASSRDIYEVEIRSNLASVLSDFREFKTLLSNLGGDLERFGASGSSGQRGADIQVENLGGVASQRVARAGIQRDIAEDIIGGIRQSLRGNAALGFLDPRGSRELERTDPRVQRLGKALDDLFSYTPKLDAQGRIKAQSQSAIDRRQQEVYAAAAAGLPGGKLSGAGQESLDALLNQSRLKAREAVDRYAQAYNNAQLAVTKYTEAAYTASPAGAAEQLQKQRDKGQAQQLADEIRASDQVMKERAAAERSLNSQRTRAEQAMLTEEQKIVATDATAAAKLRQQREEAERARQNELKRADVQAAFGAPIDTRSPAAQEQAAQRKIITDAEQAARQQARDAKRAADAAAVQAQKDQAQRSFELQNGLASGGYLPASRINEALGREPDSDTAKQAVAKAAAQEAAVRQQIVDLGRKRITSDESYMGATQRLASLEIQLSNVLQRRAAAEARLADSGGFRDQFQAGFRGASDRPYAFQLGQAVKFSAFYGAAYRIQSGLLTTLSDALQQGIEFEQSLSDLSLATGQSKDSLRDLGSNLARIAAATGQDPAAGVQIGARAIGLYGLQGAAPDQQAFAASLSTDIVSKLTFGTKADALTVQQNLAAVTNATGLGVSGQQFIADLDAFFSKRFGTTPGDTLEAAAQSGNAGIAAGFSPQQIQAMAALVESRTGQTSSAVGGYLAQIFTRGGEGSLTSTAGQLGIETAGRSLAEVLKDLADTYVQADTATKTKIAGTLGRGKVQSAGLALLTGFDDVNKAAAAADTGAGGALDRSFANRVNNIGGELATLGSTFKEFARLLGDTGILSLLGLAVVGLKGFLEATNAVLEVYDRLPGVVKDVLSSLLLLSVGLRVAGVQGGITGGLQSLTAAGGVRSLFAKGAAAGGGATALEIGSGGAASAGGAGALAALATPAAAVTAVAVAGIAVAGSLIATAQRIDEARQNAVQTLANGPGFLDGSTAYLSQASAVEAAAQKARDADNGFTGGLAQIVSFGHANDAADDLAKQLDAEAKRLRESAKVIAAADLANADPSSKFPAFNKEGLTQGLSDIANNGGSAAVQVKALSEAILGLGKVSADKRGDLGPAGRIRLATGLNTTLTSDIEGGNYNEGDRASTTDIIPGGGRNPGKAITDGLFGTGQTSGATVAADVRKQLTGEVIQATIDSFLSQKGAKKLDDLSEADIAELQNQLYGKVDFGKDSLGKLDPQALEAIQTMLKNRIGIYLLTTYKDYKNAIDGLQPISASDATGAFEVVGQTLDAQGGRLGATNYAGKIANAKKKLADFRAIRKAIKPGEDLSEANFQIKTAREQVVQAQVDQIEALRQAAVANAKSQSSATASGKKFVKQEIAAILAGGGSPDQLVAVLNSAGKGTVEIVRKSLKTMLDVAVAAYTNALFALTAAALTGDQAGVDKAGGDIKGAAGQIKHYGDLLDSLQYVTPAANPDQIPGGGGSGPTETREQKRAAAAAARAAKGGGAVRGARADLQGAAADLHAAKKGTVEYYNALASYYQAQDALAQAIADTAHIRSLLKIDQTDPVAVATLTLQEALKKLRQDRKKHKDPSVIAQDQLDIKNAQTDREAALFDQRLQDVQTADSLGRISHSAYIRYLENEHNRLQAISKRTRQQQDELNQIDQLLQDAQKSLQGAFNIGDIKLPTPYEVRRMIQGQNGQNGGITTSQQTTTIYINGADTAAVKKIITDTVGQGARVLTTTPRRT